MSITKRGGLVFFRIGRFGGSFYLAKRQPMTWEALQARAENVGLIFVALAVIIAIA